SRSCKILLFLVLLTPAAQATPAPNSVIPETLVLDQRWSYNTYTHLVLPTIDWLLSTPVNADKGLRTRHNNFLMYWLQKNEDVVVHMPGYLLRFQNASAELYFIYTGGWIKYALETKDTARDRCALAAVKTVLDYYRAGMGVPQNDYLDNLLKIEQQGNLPVLFDSTEGAANTYLFLKPPA